jgi:DNA-binding LytR/AlgR family response regulator
MKKDAHALAAVLAESGFEAQTSVFTCPNEAFSHIQSGTNVDVCFLDIIMPNTNGITLAKKLRANNFAGEIVFLTATNDFAHESYSVKAFDYLLKPITCENVKKVMSALQNLWAKADKNGLLVKTQGARRFIAFRDISYIEATAHYTNINLLDASIVEAHIAFSEMAKHLLPDSRFAQCHRSYMLNLNEIITIKKDEAIMKNDKKVPISRGYSYVKDKMVNWTFK